MAQGPHTFLYGHRVKAYTRSYPSKSRAGVKRKPEPPKKKRAKPKKGRAPKHSKAMKAIENKLVPDLNPKKGDMKDFIAAQRRMYA